MTLTNLIATLTANYHANPAFWLVCAGIGAGVLVAAIGLGSALSASDAGARRMKRLNGRTLATADGPAPRVQLVKSQDITPHGLLKSLVPDDKRERVAIREKLTFAGFAGTDAVRNFYMVRLSVAFLLPIVMFLLIAMQKFVVLPEFVDTWIVGLTPLRMAQITMVCMAVGFYAPNYWLKSRVAARRDRIEQGFPNAMDLLQISVESGMGFDAAMGRVGRELARIAPEIAGEFLQVQTEVGAGRDRSEAMMDMARRMSIAEARSFANVVAQSMQFGTSLSEALRGYSSEMRTTRELRAQEKANKLPVQMSAVMALLMLPALFLITLAPIVIRYTQM